MPGMGGSLQTGNQTIVSAFHSALLRQMFWILVVLALLAVVWNVVRTVQYRRLTATGGSFPSREPAGPEPAGRRVLRVGFGLLWLFDGLLQLQASMPLGMVPGVIRPAADSSPGWVQHLVDSGATVWSNHPVQAAAATVWIQVGLGVWLLVAPRGRWSRAGGVASAGWGLVVWVLGEAFGGLLAPGATWLFGAPGAAAFYCAAGVLIALPDRAWATPRLGRSILGVMGAFFVAMAVLQAWPGRGFWQGAVGGRAPGRQGTLTTMVQQMAQTRQPGFLGSWVGSFGSFDAAHGWAVNLFVVLALGAVGVGLLSGRPRLVLLAVVGAAVLCLADWVLVEDLGFLGGLGTDPNSMVPTLLVVAGGYVALVRVPAEAPLPAVDPAAHEAPAARTDRRWWEWVTPTYLLRAVAAGAAVVLVLVGAAPMVLAATNPNADPILTEALDGTPNQTDSPAPPFRLTDQHGRPVSLESLKGHAVALTFLDPVCTTDCPLIAQNFRLADRMLGADASRVDMVAIVANPVYRAPAFTQAFDRQEGLTGVSNWLYLTGSLSALQHAWAAYGITTQVLPGGSMVAHPDIAFIIDPDGHERAIMDSDPGDGDSSMASSYASLLASEIEQTLR
ncbi:MAG: SCO family protein [Acidimicrobiales bacterium]